MSSSSASSSTATVTSSPRRDTSSTLGLKKRSHTVAIRSLLSSSRERSGRKKAKQDVSTTSSHLEGGPDGSYVEEGASIRVQTVGEMMHDRSVSLLQFTRILRRMRSSVTLKPTSHIWDCGDVSSEAFLSKWSALLAWVPASALEDVLLRLVRQESLVLESEFRAHREMLDMLLAVIWNSKLLQRGVMTAAHIGSSDVASALLRRLRELAPSAAAQLASAVPRRLSRSSLALQDRRDEQLDARLALEDEPNSEDDDFVVSDSDDASSRDGDYEPQSAASGSEEDEGIAADDE
jgi:hypothetical protein